jgi:hypothetical protein
MQNWQAALTLPAQQQNGFLISNILQLLRHTRREAGIQRHGWRASQHPWRLDSLRGLTVSKGVFTLAEIYC